MKVVFMGTPSFAVPSLEQMVKDGHEVALVITQPDRPAGRGRRAASPPTKDVAEQHGLPVRQPRRLKDEGVLEAIQRANPDVIVVAAFGQILRRNVLELPRLGCLNVHASLLPRHRGAAPITAAILAGDNTTGISIMLMDEGLDTGPVLAQTAVPILPTDTTQSLAGRLATVGADLLSATLPRWASGEIKPQPQDDSRAT
ncbi:MAG: methionyl-tRNA formyltransferase, partial [Chloroflexota bacterium]